VPYITCSAKNLTIGINSSIVPSVSDKGMGSYHIRAYYGKLGELSEDGLDGNDHYRLDVWQAPHKEIKVIKQFHKNFQG
jgi:hypothetical protein